MQIINKIFFRDAELGAQVFAIDFAQILIDRRVIRRHPSTDTGVEERGTSVFFRRKKELKHKKILVLKIKSIFIICNFKKTKLKKGLKMHCTSGFFLTHALDILR